MSLQGCRISAVTTVVVRNVRADAIAVADTIDTLHFRRVGEMFPSPA